VQAQSSLDFLPKDGSKKDVIGFGQLLQKMWRNLVTLVINGHISFGDGINRDNIDGNWANLTTPVAPNTDFVVNHNLGRLPVGYLVTYKDRAVDVYTGSVPATTTQITLRATVASAVIRLFIFCLVLFLGASLAQAQTTVNLTVLDTASNAWGGPWTVSILPPPGISPPPIPTIVSGGGSLTTQTGTLVSGSASIILPANANLAPSGTRWLFNVCFSATGPCYTQPVTVSISSPQALILTPPAPVGLISAGVVPSGPITPSCSAGQSFIFNNTAGNQLLLCNNGLLTTASGSPATTIDMKQYGVVADLRTCIATEAAFAASSPNLTCTVGAFCNGTTVACPAGQTSDVGKRINATAGCCNASVPVTGATQALPNNTTILTVTDSTHIVASANFTISSSGTNAYVFWATDDDAAVTAADIAYQNAPVCTALLWPATPFLIKTPHFNAPNKQCALVDGGPPRVSAGSYVGWGSSNSVMYLDASFPGGTPCTFGQNSNGCFFSYNGTTVQNLAIHGGWNQKPNGGGNSYALLNPGSTSTWYNVNASGFDTANGTTVGLANPGFSYFRNVNVLGFGCNALSYVGQLTIIEDSNFGNSGCHAAAIGGSPGVSPLTTRGVSFATSALSIVSFAGGPWTSYDDTFYATTTNGTCIDSTGAGVGTVAYIDGAVIGSNSSNGCSAGASGLGIFAAASSIFYLSNSQIGGFTSSINVAGTGKIVDRCGNSYFHGTMITTLGTFVPCANPNGSTFTNAPSAGQLNCASSASPAVCGAFATGSVVIAAAATTVTVNTTAVGANSQILVNEDQTLGTKLGVTCNTQSSLVLGTPRASTRTAGTSFVITIDVGPTTNPMCISYQVVN
jgi:hypothetical protein